MALGIEPEVAAGKDHGIGARQNAGAGEGEERDHRAHGGQYRCPPAGQVADGERPDQQQRDGEEPEPHPGAEGAGIGERVGHDLEPVVAGERGHDRPGDRDQQRPERKQDGERRAARIREGREVGSRGGRMWFGGAPGRG